LISLATLSGHLYSIDGLSYYRSATTLAWQQSLIIDPPMVWGTPNRQPVWPIGFSIAQLPLAMVLTPMRSLQPVFDPNVLIDLGLLYDDPVYTSMSWLNGLIVALTTGFAFLLARQVGLSSRIAVVAALVGTLASPLFFYGRADFAQPLTAMLLVLALFLALRARSSPLSWALAALLPVGALAVLTRPVDGAITVFCCCVIVAWPTRRDEESAAQPPLKGRHQLIAQSVIVGGFVVGLLGTMAVNVVRRGDVLDFGYRPGGSDPIATALAYLISPGRGLPFNFPLILLVPLGILILWRARRRVELVALVLPTLLMFGAYLAWTSLGDVSYGPRFLVPLMPLLAILAAESLLGGWRYVRPVFAVLAGIGIVANLSLLFADQLLYWFVRGDNPVGSTGFWRQFDLGAYAPIGSLRTYHPTGLGNVADIIWLRMGHDTAWLSAVVLVLLAVGGIAALWRAVRLVRA
jgi:hypothetical protein